MNQYQVSQSWPTQPRGFDLPAAKIAVSPLKLAASRTTNWKLHSRGQTMAGLLLSVLAVALIFSFARPPFGSAIVYQAKFGLATVLLFWLLLNSPAKKEALSGRGRARMITLTFYGWTAFGAAGLLGAPYPMSGLALLLTYVVFFVLATQALPSYIQGLRTDDAERWLTSICFVSVVFGIAVLVVAGHGNPLEYVGPPTRIRYQALFLHPNFVGYFCFLAAALATRMWLHTGKRLYLLTLVPAIFLTIEADSRGALAVMFLFILSLGVSAAGFRRITVRRYLGAAIWLALTLTVVAALLGLIKLPSTEALNEALSGRIQSWGESIRTTTTKDFWLGQGLGRKDFGSIASDSYFVSSFVQTGFLGTLSLAIFLLSMLWAIRPQFAQKRGREAASEAFPFCSLAILTVYSFSENVLFSLGSILSLYVWMEAGMRNARRTAGVEPPALTTSANAGTISRPKTT